MNNVYEPSIYDVMGAGYVWVCMYTFAVLMESVIDLSAGGDPAISGND